MNEDRKIGMIDLPRLHSAYQEELNEALLAVAQSGNYIGGERVRSFEQELSDYLGVRAFGVGNGTDALLVALMALGIGPGDEVIVPAFTYAASAEVIGLLGAKVVWCDVLPDSFNIDPQSAKGALSDKTKAVIAVHLYGQLADIEALEEAIGETPIIEDGAQSFGAMFTTGKYAGKHAGSVSAYGTLSFFPTKPLGAMGDGGAVLCNSESAYHKAFPIARHGQSKKYVHDVLGVNSRLDPMQAAVLSVKLKHFEQTLERKQNIVHQFHEELGEVVELQLPMISVHSTHVWHQYTVKVMGGQRDALRTYLAEKGIATMIYYPICLADQKAYADGIERVPLQHSRHLTSEVLSIPVDPCLEASELVYLCSSIKAFFTS